MAQFPRARVQRLACTAIVLASVIFAGVASAANIPIYVFAGQSNAVGYATDSTQLSANLQASQPTVLYSGPQESSVNWGPLTPPTQTQQVVSNHGFGPELTTGKTISAALGNKTVGEVKYAVNGTSLYSDWNPDTGPLYPQMIARVNNALAQLPAQHNGDTGYIAGFFWMQGESDAGAGRTTAQYQTDLTNFIARLRTDFNAPNLPFVYGLIKYSGGTEEQVRQAQFNVDTAVNNAVLVNTDGYARDGPNDLIHFNTQGTVDLGIGFGNGYLTVAPEPASIALVGAFGLLLRRRLRLA